LSDARPFGVHRMALLGAPLAFAFMVAGGVAVRAQVRPEPAPAPTAAARPAAKPAIAASTEPAPKAQPAAAPKTAPKVAATKLDAASPDVHKAEAPRAAPPPRKPKLAAKPTATEVAAAKPEAAPQALAPAPVVAAGIIQLNILPWGEVFVDGRSRGVSPPLRVVEVPPGAHTIEVRNTTFPVHTKRVDVRSGEPVRIRHQFR
jgi:hypothetical protein